jgi:putative spermidine/putrescine transport system permease protein
MTPPMQQRRGFSFWLLAGFFACFVLFLYGPMLIIFVLSFQGPKGGLTFPIDEFSTKWFVELFSQSRSGDIAGALLRSLALAGVTAIVTVVFSFFAGLAFRRPFVGSGVLFYMTIASLIMPGLLVGLGVSLAFRILGFFTDWTTSALGAQLTWTLPFGLLIMFAVLGRYNRSVDEAASDLGATDAQRLWHVTLPIVFPGVLGVALFGFTLSYDEFPRSVTTVGSRNTLPLEIWAMTTNVTSPALYALGTMTSVASLVVVVLTLSVVSHIQRRRAAGSAPNDGS